MLLKTKNISKYAAKIVDQKEKVCYNIYIKIRKGNDFMGLDNGILLKIKDKEAFGPMPSWIKREEWEDKYGYDYDILYWRKCWNVRGEILCYLGASDDEYQWNITPDDLVNIINILRTQVYGENWDEDQSIWSWEEIGENYMYHLTYAEKIIELLRTKPLGSYQLYFYDSY